MSSSNVDFELLGPVLTRVELFFFALFQILNTGSSILSVLSGSPSLFVVSCLWVSASKLASNSSKIFHGCKIQRLMILPICTTSNIGLNQVCTYFFGLESSLIQRWSTSVVTVIVALKRPQAYKLLKIDVILVTFLQYKISGM